MPVQLDILVLGSGVAGLSAVVRLASSEDLRVGVLTKADLAQSTTRWAQGGIAAAVGGDEDSADLHLADTLAAGAGLCDADAVRVLVDEGPARVDGAHRPGRRVRPRGRRSPGAGARRRALDGACAARRRRRHRGRGGAGARGRGARPRRRPVLERWFALDLIVEGARCVGVRALDPDGRPEVVRATPVVLATGGAGQLYAVTTNPARGHR